MDISVMLRYAIILFKKPLQKKIAIMDVEETLDAIEYSSKSLCRFGDGELDIIMGKSEGYQDSNIDLANSLKNILGDRSNVCIIGVPDAINSFRFLTKESKHFWIKNMFRYRDIWLSYLSPNIHYAIANITRPYIRYKDDAMSAYIFDRFKRIWNNKDLVIIEGESTRFGVKNDLLANSRSIQRIICPATNAFSFYCMIEAYVTEHVDNNKIILLCLGPTATILAFELGKRGYKALDIGHLDIEYEWMKLGKKRREKIADKYTNEVTGGDITKELHDYEYLGQIIHIIS